MDKQTYYSAAVRNPNSWVGTPEGGTHEITWECGHKHKSAEAARECLSKMGDAACAYRAQIESWDGKDLMYSGRLID